MSSGGREDLSLRSWWNDRTKPVSKQLGEKHPDGSSFSPSSPQPRPWSKSISKETKSWRGMPSPPFIIKVFRARIDLIQETGMGEDLYGPFPSSWLWCRRLPLARGTGLTPCLLRNLVCLPHSGVLHVSGQARPQG